MLNCLNHMIATREGLSVCLEDGNILQKEEINSGGWAAERHWEEKKYLEVIRYLPGRYSRQHGSF